MNESRIERYLVNGVKKLGGMCVKFVSPGTPGVPDRIIILNGRIIFAELKTEIGRLSKIQRFIVNKMIQCGADVRVVKGLDQVKSLLAEFDDGVIFKDSIALSSEANKLLHIYENLSELDRQKLFNFAVELRGEQK